jgi:hypothetical protein
MESSVGRKERIMNSRHLRRLPVALVVEGVVAASFGPSAGAWIPSVEPDEPLVSSRTIVVVPDAAERAAKRRAQTNLQSGAAVPDAFERAVRRYARR